MKLLYYLILGILLAGCENTDALTYYEYGEYGADTTVFLTSYEEGTDSSYLSLKVSESLSHSDEISIHFLKADTIISNFRSKKFTPTYFTEDSVEMEAEYVYIFDAGKLGLTFSTDTAITISFKAKSKAVFQATLKQKYIPSSSELKIPAIKTCLTNPGGKRGY